MRRHLLLLSLLFFALPLVAEETRDRAPDGKRALRWMFAPWTAWTAESNPADWKPEMWQANGMTTRDWEDAIREWEKDPAVAEKLRRGREFREKYVKEKDAAAQKLITPEGNRDPALGRMITEYAAFAQSQRRMRLGPPSVQQAENFAREQAKPFEDLIAAGSTDPILAWEAARAYNRGNRRAENSEFPGISKSAKEQEWIAWRERNRKVTEAEIIERFRQAMSLAQKDTPITLRVGKKRISPKRLAAAKLKVDWKKGDIVWEDGRDLIFGGETRAAAELAEFLVDPKGTPVGEIAPKRDATLTAVHRLKLEVQGLKNAVLTFDKTSHEEATKQVLARLQRSGRDLNETLADPLEATPFKNLVHAPGSAADEVLEAMIWNGFRRSPKHFRRRDGFFRIAFPFEQVLSGSLLSEKTRARLGRIVLTGVFLALASDQAWEHRKEIAELAERYLQPTAEEAMWRLGRSVDLEKVEPYVPKSWVEYVKQKAEASEKRHAEIQRKVSVKEEQERDKLPNEHGGTGDRLPPPSTDFRKKGAPPSQTRAYEVLKKPNNDFSPETHPLTIADAGFSKVALVPYDPAAATSELGANWVAEGSRRLRVGTKMRPTLEKGKLVLPHSEGFLLLEASVRLRPKGEGASVFDIVAVGPGTPYPFARNEQGYYVVDFSANPSLAETHELDAAHFEAEYVQVPRTDYLQKDLAISDPTRVETLAKHFAEAGMGRIAEGLREEAKWMRELKYSIYPDDVAKRIRMGSLYSHMLSGKDKSPQLPEGNLFGDLGDLAYQDHLCTKCAGSAEVNERALAFLYEGTNVQVGQRSLVPGGETGWNLPYHADNIIQAEGGRRVTADAQAVTQDPRNDKEGGPFPTEDVLHSPGQDDPFSPDKLPELEDPLKKTEAEAQKTGERQNLTFISAGRGHEETLFQEFIRRLGEVGPMDHKFRFRGDLPKENERPKPLPPEPPKPRVIHPKIIKLLAELEVVRNEMLDDVGFRKLNLHTRLQIQALPLSGLYRSYLLGDLTKTQFHESLQTLLPVGHPLKGKEGASTQELMKAVAAEQRKIYERVIAAAAGPSSPTVKSMGNPVMTDKILAIFDKMGTADVDPLVDPASRKTLLKSAFSCFGLLSRTR